MPDDSHPNLISLSQARVLRPRQGLRPVEPIADLVAVAHISGVDAARVLSVRPVADLKKALRNHRKAVLYARGASRMADAIKQAFQLTDAYHGSTEALVERRVVFARDEYAKQRLMVRTLKAALLIKQCNDPSTPAA